MLHVKTLAVGPMAANAHLVYRDGCGDALIIDAGDDATRILRACEAENTTPRAVLLTHGHFDHILAAPEIRAATGAKIYIHENDAPMLSDAALNLYMPMATNTKYVPFEADEKLKEGMLDCAGFQVRLLSSPGHTPGGLSFYFEEDNVLFTGDTLFDGGGIGRTDFPGGDERALYRSIEKLLELPVETRFFAGHNSASTIGAARRFFR